LQENLEASQSQMAALEEKYNFGSISEGEYQEAKARLEKEKETVIEEQLEKDIKTTTAKYLTPSEMHDHLYDSIQARIISCDVWRDFQQVKELGAGAAGDVYLSKRKTGAKEYVAVKVLKSRIHIKHREDMVREVSIMLACDHPNLVKLHSVYQARGEHAALVMELIEPLPRVAGPAAEPDLMSHFINTIQERVRLGINEHQAIQRGMPLGLSMYDCARCIMQVASAIHYLNTEHNVIHRDLKPDNVLVGVEGFARVRVADYGHARMFQVGAGESKTMQKGTPGYSAPEMVRSSGMGGDDAYDARVDVWSLGCIAYMCAVSAPAFPVARRYETAFKYEQTLIGEYKAMDGPLWSPVAPEFIRLIERMLVYDYKERIEMGEVLADPWLITTVGAGQILQE